MKHGIDVSQHNGKIDWCAVRTDFAILRAGYGKVSSQIDKQFRRNYECCKYNNIPVGAYWYSYAMSEEEAREEAKAFLKVIEGLQFEYPVYYDVEEAKQIALGKKAVSNIIRAFAEVVEKAGYFVGLYSSVSILMNCVDDNIRKRYSIWCAHWNTQSPSYSGDYAMWQHSSKGEIRGIKSDVDLNVCYSDFTSIIKRNGLNGFKKGGK